jgi:hypothetical protein
MARELVWLEDNTFAAWGCKRCGWILPGKRSNGPSPEVKEAFSKHECAKTPRRTSSRKGSLKRDTRPL